MGQDRPCGPPRKPLGPKPLPIWLSLHQNRSVSAIAYPIAANADAALNAPLGRALRESQARALGGGEAVFARELTGPAFDSRAEALAAYAGRLDDPEARVTVAPEDRYCDLQAVVAMDGGPRALRTVWRLQVGYWRTGPASEAARVDQARRARRGARGPQLDNQAVNALAREPLRPLRPQQPLDIGLFETPRPEAPDRLIPDE